MAIEVTGSGRTLIYDGLAQNDIDMAFHKLLNLDDSNLDFGSAPPSIDAGPHKWLKTWNATTRTWSATQPAFTDISGALTLGVGGQQRAITELGTIGIGTWQASIIGAAYLPTLNAIKVPVADVSMANHKLTNLADPTVSTDAVNLRFVDSMLAGLNPKGAVRLATAAPTNRSGLPIVDGKQTAPNDRILVKDGVSTANFQGIYVIGTDPSHIWTRSPDCNQCNDPTHPETDINRAYCRVLDGDTNKGTAWVQVNPCSNVNPDSALEPKHFIQFSTAGDVGTPGPTGPPGPGVPPGGSPGQVVTKGPGGDYDTLWASVGGGIGSNPVYAQIQTVRVSPTGTTNSTGVMMGLGRAPWNSVITPSKSGKIAVHVCGWISSNSPAGIAVASLRLGFLPAPANGAAITGNTLGGVAFRSAMPGPSGVDIAVPFSLTFTLWDLTIGDAIWIDVQLQGQGGLAKIGDVTVSAYEIP